MGYKVMLSVLHTSAGAGRARSRWLWQVPQLAEQAAGLALM